jgi:L-methionine (R)-S-oxide reductase
VGLRPGLNLTDKGNVAFSPSRAYKYRNSKVQVFKQVQGIGMSNYEQLLQELEGYARSATGVEALMAHIAQRLHKEMARYNWVGFYLADESLPRTLVVGPYEGSFLPLQRISFDVGLCGQAATTRRTVVVNDISANLHYVSATDLVKSEMVVPILVGNALVGEIDVESYFVGTFSKQDQEFVEACTALVGRFMEKRAGEAANTSEAVNK